MLDSGPVSASHCSFREGVVDLSTVTGSDTCFAATLPLLQFFFGSTITRGEGALLHQENMNNGTRPTG
jgi:hypothetical protein